MVIVAGERDQNIFSIEMTSFRNYRILFYIPIGLYFVTIFFFVCELKRHLVSNSEIDLCVRVKLNPICSQNPESKRLRNITYSYSFDFMYFHVGVLWKQRA